MKKKNYYVFCTLLCMLLAFAPVITALEPAVVAAAATPTPTPSAEGDVRDAMERLESDNNGAFSAAEKALANTVASAYKTIRNVGFMILLACGIAAGILFGILKNEQAIQRNKTWLIRLIAAVALVTLIPTIFATIAGIADKV
jgi:hypothetical protein